MATMPVISGQTKYEESYKNGREEYSDDRTRHIKSKSLNAKMRIIHKLIMYYITLSYSVSLLKLFMLLKI